MEEVESDECTDTQNHQFGKLIQEQSESLPDTNDKEENGQAPEWMKSVLLLDLVLIAPWCGLSALGLMGGYPYVLFEEDIDISSITFSLILVYPLVVLICAICTWLFSNKKHYNRARIFPLIPIAWGVGSICLWSSLS